jgi:ATP-dependent Clp protease ATP-binding subunit ClpB
VITDVFVDTRVSATLGIPVGPIRDGEREMLLHLEEELHKRVVGQEAALSAIAGAMRRARSGIGSTKRPIGSFLFLGSTGVGKTETAKALAALFFGGEEKMVRFDMSEFSGRDGLMRLIGDSVHAGALASALKEHPYCVLLLDELEKATTEVHDLFLQVLDEGMFTDGRGSRVNARNTIVVATSNAGSALIWELTQAGRRPQDEKDRIIDTVISERIFRPELINRFDATIIFASLAVDEQRTIARFMLADLEKRIRDRGYTLVVNDALLDVLMKQGYNPEFGARPMRRAIQDVIEERVARKIIEGRLRPGTSIEFTSADFV